MLNICAMDKYKRLEYLGYRIFKLEINYPPIMEWDKFNRAIAMFWRVIEDNDNISGEEWEKFFNDNKMWKYIKILEGDV